MNKVISLLLAIVMAVSLCACGSSAPATTPTLATPAPTEEPNELDELAKELEKIGKVEVENGILSVEITIPATMVTSGRTQADLDKYKGENYISAKLNDDGSITYKLTKEQHKAMMDGVAEAIDSSIESMLSSGLYSINQIEHNDDFTVFDIVVKGNELPAGLSITAISFEMLGGMYKLFNGGDSDIIVNYYAEDGAALESFSSANLG